jgi:N4-gp56 family major capsid protein
MALTISATDVELQKPVNVIFQQTLLRNAQARCPYFVGTTPGSIQKNGGSATIKWRRIENITPTTTALSELTGNASYMQGRDSTAASFTDFVATVAKYGQFFILNEEVDLFNFNGQTDKLVQVLGISAGRSLNQLQRNVVDDNATLVRPASAASDGVITSKITAATIESVVNTLNRNSAMTFTPETTGSVNIGTVPILPAFWGLCHPDVAYDISKITGFVSVEKYAGQVQTTMGEFGLYASAGMAVRFIQTEDGTIDADSGGAKGSTGLRSTTGTDIDLYTTAIYGMDAIGSVGLGSQYGDGVYRAGDATLGPIEMITKGLGSGGTSDPFNEIQTLAWKAWHAGKITNPAWVRAIRSGATALT